MPEPQDHKPLLDGLWLQKICKETPAFEDDHELVERLQKAFPEYTIRVARVGHEWYRIGGVVTQDGQRIALDINEWAERTLIECGYDFETFLNHCIEEDFLVTQHVGVSVYITIETGPNAEDFIQIEVDRTQELANRYLIDPEEPPEDLEELIDPIAPAPVAPFNIAPPQYVYRRKTDVGIFMAELARHRSSIHPAQHFMSDWNSSSAAQETVFCQHWSLRLFRRIGRHGEQNLNVEVVSNNPNKLARLESPEGKKGKALATLIGQYDSQAGYPFAWYFNMIGGTVSPLVGESVWKDLSKDYAYLPNQNTQILAKWITSPYYL